MVHHYTQLPISQPHHRVTQHDREVEMQAAFDYSDDEDDEHTSSEAHPLNPVTTAPISLPTPTHVPGTYNFDTVDYDYPPPGSPPPPSALALPNNHGNSNGLVPEFDPLSSRPRRMWFQRAAVTVLPSSILSAMGLAPPSGPIGGGTNNDGVFANVTAKPTAPNRVQDGDDIYVVPEDARQEAPPSYASAQADAVPPYWETTVHAPFAPDSIGEMVVGSLPTGSLFSFCWNLLVSVSFQFVGFLLTYLLHTSHAARLGSRAGLGITLIQYGFALRNRVGSSDGVMDKSDWSDWGTDTPPRHGHHGNTTWGSHMTEQPTNGIADATSEWLSFLLMTIGWFVLLTSLLGFWRVKRWEHGILAARRDSSVPTSRNPNFVSQFGLGGISHIELLRQGFGFARRSHQEDDEFTRVAIQTEEGGPQLTPRETDPMMSTDSSDPQPGGVTQALENDRRLQRHLRDAGFI
ncbi:hypothetical protein BYT27DRAFT_7183016 [Phlegmacium glaucopus]|nr:hypothetical protein BYT27DRAFT_7183016 [Phlegmacium glaucopus]